jgi:hypothetical protein
MAFASAADAVLGPPDHTVSLTSEQYGQAISDYLTKHKLLPPGRYHQAASAVQEKPGVASLVVHCWRSDDPVETTAERRPECPHGVGLCTSSCPSKQLPGRS